MIGVTGGTNGAQELQEGQALQPGLVSEYSAVGQARRLSPSTVNRLSIVHGPMHRCKEQAGKLGGTHPALDRGLGMEEELEAPQGS